MASRKDDHRAFIARLGFSADDLRRIREHAELVTDIYSPPPLDDLSVPIIVAAVQFNPNYPNNKLGVITRADGRKVALSYYRMHRAEQDAWEARIRGGVKKSGA